MNIKTLIVSLLTITVLSGMAQAQTGGERTLPDPGMLPDHPLYFFKTWFENAQTSLTFGDVAKADRYAGLADVRLAEARALAAKGKLELAEEAVQKYDARMSQAENSMDRASAQGLNTTAIIERLTETYERHQAVLAEVYERVPDRAKPAIQRAMNNSQRAYEHAIEVLENLPPTIMIPENFSERIKERHNITQKRMEELRNRSIPVPTMPRIEDLQKRANRTISSGAGQWLSVQASTQGSEIVVIVKAGGMPLSEVDIYVDDEKVGVTDSNGQYIYRAPAPGKVTVKAEKGGYLSASTTISVGQTTYDAGELAMDYLKNDATFKYDGMPETLGAMGVRYPSWCTDCWVITISFDSRNAGYGDRSGQMLAQVITPHVAKITVEGGKITSAIMDDRWDMMIQRMR